MRPRHALAREVASRRGQERRRLQDVVRRHREHHVQLEVAALTSDGDGRVVADDLRDHLNDRLRNDRIDLARHDGAARLHLRQHDFADARAGARAEPPDVVGDLVEG